MNWGGFRPGGGRPATGRRKINFYITDEEANKVKQFINTLRSEVAGYDTLSDEDKQLFDEFKQNYIATNGSDIKIEFVAVKRQQNHLRVDLKRNERATYQEVFSPTSWG